MPFHIHQDLPPRCKSRYLAYCHMPCNLYTDYFEYYLKSFLLLPSSLGGRTIWHRTIWHRTIWHPDNLAPGQFGTGQFGTRTIWHQHNKNRRFGTGQFGTRTIWHQYNKTDNPKRSGNKYDDDRASFILV